MQRFFVKNILFVLTVNLLVKPIWIFFIERTVQNTIPMGEYGTYQALLSLSIIFQIILDFGITSYNTNTLAHHPEKLPRLFPEMLITRLLLMGVYMLSSMAIGYVLGYRGLELYLLLMVLCIQSAAGMVAYLRSNIAALHLFKIDGLLSIADKIIMILICGLLLYTPQIRVHFQLLWFIYAQIIAFSIASVIAYLYISKKISHIEWHLPKLPDVLNIVKGSLPYAVLIFQMSIYNRADAMMVERMCADGKEQTGIWASAFRQLDIANMIGLLFASMLMPMYGKLIAQKQPVEHIVKLSVNLLLPISVAVSTVAVMYSDPIMSLLYHGAATGYHATYVHTFALLIGSFPAWCLMYIYCSLLTANNSLILLNKIALVGVVFNLVCNYLLIEKYGVVGAALTSLLTQYGLSFAFIYFSKTSFSMKLNVAWLTKLGAFIGMSIMVTIAIKLYVPLTWVYQMVVAMMVHIAIIAALKFISIKDVSKFLKSR